MSFINTCSRRLIAVLGMGFGLVHLGLQPSWAQPLAVAYVQNGVGGSQATLTSMMVYVGFGPNTNAVLFSQFALTPADVGRTFTLNASNDPDFAAAKLSLENGIPNAVVFGDYYGPGTGWSTHVTSEAYFFDPLPPGNNGIDFQGFSIGSISLTVDALTLTPRVAGGTDIHLRGTISVNAVPEPSTLALVVGGGLVLQRFASRRKRF